ncbi:MAG: SPOR domain-containing protein, partial [Endozoicomonas sp.]
ERTSVVQLASLSGLNSVIEISGISVDTGSAEQVIFQAEETESHSDASSQLPLDDSIFISFEPEPSGSGVEQPVDNHEKSRTDDDIVDTELREEVESPFSDRVSLALNNESPDPLTTEVSLEKEAPKTAIETSEQSDHLLPDTGVLVEKNMTNKERLQQEMENEALLQPLVSDESRQVFLADLQSATVEVGADDLSETLTAGSGKNESLQVDPGDAITNDIAQNGEKSRQLWKLQVAAFKKINNAEKLRQELLTRGIDAYIETRASAGQKALHRVYAGPAAGDFEAVKETLETELNLVSGQVSPYKG